MKNLIANFPLQLEEALQIGERFTFKSAKRKFDNVVICGLGGSGIGGSYVRDITIDELTIPLTVVKGYFLPKFVNQNTLVIISSYSGNTEETVECFHEAIKRNSFICAVSSNGEVMKICAEKNLDAIAIPGGHPPRACLAYSFVQVMYILLHFDLISDSFKVQVKNAAKLLTAEQEAIKKEAYSIAEKIKDKIPVLYSADNIESISVRWRQQINENGKKLCWHHVLPEMNHNELVGWRTKIDNLAVIFLRNESDYPKIQKRMDLNKKVYEQYVPHIIEVWSKGATFIEKTLYLVSIGDWISFYLAELNGFDVTEVKVIDELKANLK